MAISSAGGETHGAPLGECARFSLILGSYWCKRPLWAVSEAAELSRGHLPGDECYFSSGVNALRRLFMVERHKLITGAIDAGQLPCIKSREGESVKPRDFVEWAERYGHDIPQAMRDYFRNVSTSAARQAKKPRGSEPSVANPSRLAPYLAKARKVAFDWLEYNGAPEWGGDGEQAKLETHISEWLVNNGSPKAESTVRQYVRRWIDEFKQQRETAYAKEGH